MASNGAVRVAVAGARGRTGSVVTEALRKAPGVEVVATLVRPGAALSEGEYTSLESLAKTARPVVLVDFTKYPDSKSIALGAIALGIRPVIGTSGYHDTDLDELRLATRRAGIGAIYAPNFSIGANLMMQFARIAAPFFTHATIVETHHAGKKDAPSGTAVATAKIIAQASRMQRQVSDLVRVEGARGADVDGVEIHSIRTPGVVAKHEVQFANENESLTIAHSSSTRNSFVPGVIWAIEAAATLDHLIEGLGEITP